MLGSIVPAAGDIVTNSIMLYTNAAKQDLIDTYDPVGQDFVLYTYAPAKGGWTTNNILQDPITTSVSQGFFYFNNINITVATNYWVENFTL
jgi:hypothetical protein